MKLNFLFVIALFFSITLVVAQPPFTQPITGTPGYNVFSIEAPFTHKANTSYTLHIHITNNTNGKLINNSITCFYHLTTFNGTEVTEGFISSQDGYLNSSYIATIGGGNFSNLGLHNILIECIDAGGIVGSPARVTIDVTQLGFALTTPNAILYGIIDFLVFSFLCLTLYFGIVLPFRNERNNLGKIININWLKYLKIFCWAMFYFLLVVFTWIAWNLIYAYSDWQSLGIILKYFFFLELALALPIFIGIVIIGFINWISDRKIGESINKFGESD